MTPRDEHYCGDPALKCGPETLRALAVIVGSHAAAPPHGVPLTDEELRELHPYLQDAQIWEAVKALTSLQ